MIRQFFISFVMAAAFILLSAGQAFSFSPSSDTKTDNTFYSVKELATGDQVETGKPKKQKAKLNHAKRAKAVSYSNHSVKKTNWQNTRKISCSVNPGLNAKKNWKTTSPAPVNERKKTTRVYKK